MGDTVTGDPERIAVTDRAPNHYEVLGVPPTATDEEIHKAYLVLLRRSHPDLAGGDPAARAAAEEQTKVVNEAYTVLRERRSDYDRELAAERAAQSSLEEELRLFEAAGRRNADWDRLRRRREEAMAQAMRRGAADDRAWRDAAQARMFAELLRVLSQPLPGQDFLVDLGLTRRAWRYGSSIRAPFDQTRLDLPPHLAPGRYTVPGHGRWGLNGGPRGDLHIVVRHVGDDGAVVPGGFATGTGPEPAPDRAGHPGGGPVVGTVVDGGPVSGAPPARRGLSPLTKALVLLVVLLVLVALFG